MNRCDSTREFQTWQLQPEVAGKRLRQPHKSHLFIRACIGRYREVHRLFDSSLRELVLPSVSIIPAEFQVNRSNIVSILAANTERSDWDIGRRALTRKSVL